MNSSRLPKPAEIKITDGNGAAVSSLPEPRNLSCRYFTHATETIIWAAKNKKSRHKFNYALMKQINGGKQMKSARDSPAGAVGEALRQASDTEAGGTGETRSAGRLE